MIGAKVQEAFNQQANAELYSSYLYLSMSAWFQTQNLSGLAAWMRVQSQEEYGHAMKFLGQVLERNGKVTLAQIEAPKAEWSSAQEAFQDAYQHECKVSGMIHQLADLAAKEKDHAAAVFLQWFVSEQVEEEATALSIAEKLKLNKGHSGGLFMLDRELGQRGK